MDSYTIRGEADFRKQKWLRWSNVSHSKCSFTCYKSVCFCYLLQTILLF